MLVACGDDVTVAVAVIVAILVAVAVGVNVGTMVKVAVADAASVGVNEGVLVPVAVDVAVGVTDEVGVSVGISVEVAVEINVGRLVSVTNWDGVKGKVTVAIPGNLDKVSNIEGVNVDCTPLTVARGVGVIIAGGKVGEGSFPPK